MRKSRNRSKRHRIVLAVLGAVAVAAVCTAGARQGVARTAERSASSLPAAHPPNAEARDRHRAVRDRLGLPAGIEMSALHIESGDGALEEVADLDGSRQPVAITQFDQTGALRLAVRLDGEPLGSARRSPAAGNLSAIAAAESLGLARGRPSRLDDDQSTGGWIATWDRTEAGTPVRGDGTTVVVWPDGRVASVSSRRRALAPAPVSRIAATRAMAIAQGLFGSSTARPTPALRMTEPTLEWVAPNGAFDRTRPIGGESRCRLAWVVTARGVDAEATPSQVTVYVDAGDGSVLGGDLVE
jgi:hypothetical protein